VEGYRTGNLTLPQQYPLVEAAHAHRLGAYVLALNRLPLTENRTYTPTWKSEILSSKVASAGETGGQTGGATGGQPGAPSVSNQVSPNLVDPDWDKAFESATNVEEVKSLHLRKVVAGGSSLSSQYTESYDVRFKRFKNQLNET
jgi:hypothetical protein